MVDHLAGMFGSAVGMLSSSPARSLEMFTEITNYDETACDAWVGRIRCGDTDRVTLFRAWYSRSNFGQLAGSAEISMNGVGARIPIGGIYGQDISYPINSPLAITMGFAVHEATEGNYADAMEALEAAPSGGSDHLVAWVKAVIYAAAQRWTDVIEQVRGADRWPDKFLAAAAGVAHGVAAANLGLFTEADRRLTEANDTPAGQACAPVIAWYLAMARRYQGNEESAQVLLEWLQANFPEPKVTAALRDPAYRLETTTAEKIAARTDPWDPSSVVADTSGRDKLLAEAQAELDKQIGLSRVKEQIEAYRAATQMARIRAARGMKVAQTSKHMIFAGPPGTGKTTIARVVANILAGLGVIAEPKLIETSRKDFVAEYEGQSAVKTAKTIDRALGGVLFIDEAYTLVQERDGRADPFGTEALDTLLARMENDRDRLVVIIAGYSNDIDRLLETNDGLRSRFATRIEFDSYSPDDIVEITKVIANANDSQLDDTAAKGVHEAATLLSQRTLNGKPALDIAGNGRYARQLVEAGEQNRDMRLARSLDFENLGVEQLREVNGEDMAAAIAAVHSRLNIGE
ncbi:MULTISPECIES: type VII secretion AAA-ATPase EccA [unclassified Mycolicibacterium]|uniref:type VII secretion AAA-ATPase EccA n=1 Tax=unclassified Mycolicibacterium TaxID=2636767 RepID=UPI0012DD117A|nr:MULTISPECIES: type VII secretion AAA-ATPase EccA [unclassified Mycolicibacterium]MUL82862.1 type VII secretion AAA-ATPase EccA [Mycolicibacterium sp. CBMA 329]MUL89197.1 type VII secretion AAA-ATPase EccA [Mycolicibacterium sp. CBMA 331]MUL97764.1 type VII secretion AAA-ATPase EccA [Mycolicibacterium sp. CBMA 334]MUM25123.1 type VII secretion AAA-ATPase EccA [Mycolicibacterium sp. CBMA 295]MUM38713.1 type VII secretion AAA-ATPase EccA [Mycolicibacterium sp. CBMA 247]